MQVSASRGLLEAALVFGVSSSLSSDEVIRRVGGDPGLSVGMGDGLWGQQRNNIRWIC